MVFHKILDHAIEHKAALIFAGGVATAVVGKKVLESKTVKDATTNAMAEVISMKQDAEKTVEEMKAEAEEKVEEETEE